MKKVLIALFAATSVFAGVSAASAADGSDSANLTVRATLKEGCSINFGNADAVIDFRVISALNNERVEHGKFNISCSALKDQVTGYKALPVKLSAGSGKDSSSQGRFLDNGDAGSKGLAFQVFQGNVGSSSGAVVWGDKDGDASFGSYPVTVSSSQTAGGEADYPYTVILLKNTNLTENTGGVYKSTMVATVDYSKV